MEKKPKTEATDDQIKGDRRPEDAAGSYGQLDFSVAAQRSRVQTQPEMSGPRFSAGKVIKPKPSVDG